MTREFPASKISGPIASRPVVPTTDGQLFLATDIPHRAYIGVEDDWLLAGTLAEEDEEEEPTTDHGALTGLSDDDHGQYLHFSTQRVILAQHSFSPLAAQAPFTLGANAQGQLVTGLEADQLNKTISVSGLGLSGGGLLTLDRAIALASSSNPGGVASVLASDASGYLQLVRLGIATAPSYPLHVIGEARIDGDLTLVGAQSIVTTADTLTLAPAADLDLTPGGTARVRATSGVRLQSDDYVSQTTGWGISYAGSGDFRLLYADEMHVKVFIADLEQALAGGQIISKSVAPLAVDFVAPAAEATATLIVESFKGFATFKVFVDGDIVRVREFSRGGVTLLVRDCWGTVVWVSNNADLTQTYTFTRSAAPNAGTIATSEVIGAGTLVLDYGTTGNGFLESNAIDGAMAEYAPYHQIVSWTTHPATGLTVRTRLGNLKGIFNVANEYGLYAGAGITDADQYLRISNTAVEAHNLPIKLYDGASVTMQLSPTAPSFAMGSTLPSAYGTGDGLWMGKDTIYKFRVGDVDGELLAWDGTDLYLKASASDYLKITGTSLEFYAGTKKVLALTNTPAVTIGEVGASLNNILISAGVLSVRNNTTERIGMTAAGILTIKDSAGAAVITLDASAGAEITKKLTMPGAASAIAIGSTPPTSATVGTGIWLDRTGMYGLNANTQETTLSATTGRITGGGGEVIISQYGIECLLTTSYTDSRSYKFTLATGGTPIGGTWMYDSAGATEIKMQCLAPAAHTAAMNLISWAPSGYDATMTLMLQSGTSNCDLVFNSPDQTAIFEGFDYVQIGEAGVYTDTRIMGGLYVGGVATDPGAGTITSKLSDAATNTAPVILSLNHSTSGTPAQYFGSALILRAQTTTTENVNQCMLASEWVDPTHASYTSLFHLYASDAGGARRVMTGKASGTAPMVGFLGAAAVIRANHIANPTGGTPDAEARTAINAILVVIENLGFTATS